VEMHGAQAEEKNVAQKGKWENWGPEELAPAQNLSLEKEELGEKEWLGKGIGWGGKNTTKGERET